SIHTEIHNEKLDKACEMLVKGSGSTTEIAALCGYPSLQYMYAVFKKHYDKTPREYREEHSL
ncbi:MAG: helix-turn-helix domain-containing protein, partial [Paraglaciecola chathamensis]